MGILEQIEAAGIVGCGGAGFPTHKKLTGSIACLIVNGAECEPLLWTDRYLMREKAPQLVGAVSRLKEELNIPRCVIAVKGHYRQEVDALRQAIRQAGAQIELHELESFYPAGDEQTIVYEVTGKVVPPGGIPIAVGAVVQNVATIYAISQAVEGRPFTRKYLTVTGEVAHPVVLDVPLGTSYRTCLELAGGALEREFFLVTGGPMMGKPLPMEELDGAVVTKTTSGILVLPAQGYHARVNQVDLRHMLGRARSACIQCNSCTQLCPRHMLGHPLEPHRIMRKMAMGGPVSGMLEDPVIRTAQLCCECGICEVYACPMGLFPRKINAMLKRELAAAGVRWQGGDAPVQASPYREDRKAPTEKVAARAGVAKYGKYQIRELLRGEPERVELPVRMHIGAPAVPLVQVGQKVQEGDVVARPEEGKLGAVIHASISGTVKAVGERIVIEKE